MFKLEQKGGARIPVFPPLYDFFSSWTFLTELDMGDYFQISKAFSFIKYIVIKYSKKSKHELASLGLKANNQLMVREYLIILYKWKLYFALMQINI